MEYWLYLWMHRTQTWSPFEGGSFPRNVRIQCMVSYMRTCERTVYIYIYMNKLSLFLFLQIDHARTCVPCMSFYVYSHLAQMFLKECTPGVEAIMARWIWQGFVIWWTWPKDIELVAWCTPLDCRPPECWAKCEPVDGICSDPVNEGTK